MPLGLVVASAKSYTETAKGRFQGDLIQIALYFCLGSCEYTKKFHKRTTQFRFRDLQFHDASGILHFYASALCIRQATEVTLYLDIQKNSIRGESITMEEAGITFGCTVGAAAERLLHLRLHYVELDTPICNYFSSGGSEVSSVTSLHVVASLFLWMGHICFKRLGFRPTEISSHSLHLGGAVKLHQAVISDSTIKVIGR